MADGTCKPVEAVVPGDYVLSAQGAGVLGPSRVLRVERVPAAARRRDNYDGWTARCVDAEHIHFAGYLYGTTPQQYLTYLMRRGDRFRLGTTSVYTGATVKPVLGLHNRCVQEHADAVWVVSTHASEQDARLEELELSLRC